jgi:hypothetical protein
MERKPDTYLPPSIEVPLTSLSSTVQDFPSVNPAWNFRCIQFEETRLGKKKLGFLLTNVRHLTSSAPFSLSLSQCVTCQSLIAGAHVFTASITTLISGVRFHSGCLSNFE